MEDIAIIDLYWAREEEAITQTDRKYGPMCRTLSYHILSDRQDSEECVNDTWHKAWDTMPPQRPDSLRAYLGRIVRNLSISRLRQRTAQKRGGALNLMWSELEDCLPAPTRVDRELEAKEASVAWERDKRKVWYILFSASGFTPELVKEAESRTDLELCIG